jgi:hypothetical protein
MRKIIILAAFALMACKPTPAADQADLYPNLPRSESMKTEGEIKPPQAAVEFCERNPEFEQC